MAGGGVIDRGALSVAAYHDFVVVAAVEFAHRFPGGHRYGSEGVARKSVDAVLANKSTHYLYFCAKEDFSGRHNFASTPEEHIANARKFHKSLNDKNIH